MTTDWQKIGDARALRRRLDELIEQTRELAKETQCCANCSHYDADEAAYQQACPNCDDSDETRPPTRWRLYV